MKHLMVVVCGCGQSHEWWHDCDPAKIRRISEATTQKKEDEDE